MSLAPGANLRPAAYALLNIVSASGIVFANKAVMSTYGFHFVVALTLIHTVATIGGMKAFEAAGERGNGERESGERERGDGWRDARADHPPLRKTHCFLSSKKHTPTGLYEKKILPTRALVPLAAAYVGYIVLNNLNLNLNTVGFYQITKIAVAPAVLAAEAVFLGKKATPRVTASIAVVCLGVGLATVTDPQLGAGFGGLLVGAGAVAATAAYQIWAGTKQKELGAGSMQLLDQYAPLAAGMLAILVPLMEPVGLNAGSLSPEQRAQTLLGFHYSLGAVVAILVSAALGLLVSLSTFLVIGATSSLTYNVVGHVKTVIILAGGCLFFGDEMPAKKLGGIGVAMAGIVWYSQLKLAAASSGPSAAASTPPVLPVTAPAGGGAGGAGPGGGAASGVALVGTTGKPASA
jgi:solute carrier family 35, member E3